MNYQHTRLQHGRQVNSGAVMLITLLFLLSLFNFFRKHFLYNPSFFDSDGVSQYTGTTGSPDIVLSGTDSELRIYKPFTPGALCTVKSKGASGRISRVVSAELVYGPSGTEGLSGSWKTQ